MDFTLTAEQELVRDTARSLLAARCPPSLVRETEHDPRAADAVWPHLRDWVALGDGPLVDLCLFLEEAGAVVLPGPFLPTTALFVPLLRAVGHPDADAAADAAVAGELTGTVALAGRSGQWVLADDDVRTFVLEADGVDRVAVVLPGPSVAVLAPPPEPRQVGTLDWSRRVFELPVPSGARHDALGLGTDALHAVVERATVAFAAELVGTTRWIVDTTVAYAKERVQFDQPIGAFQAVQHKLADMSLDLERARAAVQYAAMAVDADDPDRHRAAHVAKAAAGAAAERAVTDGIQLHGGIGYTWDHDLHLHLRRALLTETLLGTTTWHHDRLAELLLA